MSPAFDRMQALPDTRRVERPRLESRPLPEGWAPIGGGFAIVRIGKAGPDVLLDVEPTELGMRREEDEYARAVSILAGIQWVRHERAVRAQEGGR
mgnify:CR=1 FL=1